MKKYLGIYSSETWDNAMTAEVFYQFYFQLYTRRVLFGSKLLLINDFCN